MSEGGGTTNLAPSEEPVAAEELAAPEELAASEGLAAPEGIHLSTQLRYEILLGHDGFDLCKCAICLSNNDKNIRHEENVPMHGIATRICRHAIRRNDSVETIATRKLL